ncbi:MAG: endolytic transglycosylase MltG [Candidatus Paceibacterota bacterium]|jgi:UPF0755 protein
MLKIFSKKLIITTLAVITVIIFVGIYASIAPKDFPTDRTIITVKSGQYLSQVADNLTKNNIIKSPTLFKIFVVLLSGHRSVKAADYLFDEPQSVLRVAYRFINGIQNLPKIKVTIYEGSTAKSIGETIKKSIPKFDLQTFLVLAKPYEGYLFPDTYYFYENVKPDDVVAQLRDTFNQKIKTELLAIQASGKSLEDVIKMASIVEKEASSTKDRKIIAGILLQRIKIGMPLQVDVPFYYVLNKKAGEGITLADLAIDSPYNTYKHTGLPPTPISNPGLDSIEAVLTPTKTNYLFYLSDSKGGMHYAVDHNGHLVNKDKYIP